MKGINNQIAKEAYRYVNRIFSKKYASGEAKQNSPNFTCVDLDLSFEQGARFVLDKWEESERWRGFNNGGIFEHKSPTLSSNSWEQNNLLLWCDIRRDEGVRIRNDGKSGTLLSRARTDESCGQSVIQLNPSTESGGKQPYQQSRVYSEEGKMTCLDLDKRKNVYHNHRIRRLTPTECARLQTVPDWYEWIVSESQQYKMLGNGWTIDVIVHMLSFLKYRIENN